MNGLADLFAQHMALVFFVYGLAWVLMGLAVVASGGAQSAPLGVAVPGPCRGPSVSSATGAAYWRPRPGWLRRLPRLGVEAGRHPGLCPVDRLHPL